MRHADAKLRAGLHTCVNWQVMLVTVISLKPYDSRTLAEQVRLRKREHVVRRVEKSGPVTLGLGALLRLVN